MNQVTFRKSGIAIPAILVFLFVACAAGTPLGKAKEGLLYDKEVAVGVLTEATHAYDAKALSGENFKLIVDLYRKYRAVHNLAVDGVAAADLLARAGKAYDRQKLESLRLQAMQAFRDLVETAMAFRLLKEKP